MKRRLTDFTHKDIFGFAQARPNAAQLAAAARRAAGSKIATFIAKRFRGWKARDMVYRPGGPWFRRRYSQLFPDKPKNLSMYGFSKRK